MNSGSEERKPNAFVQQILLVSVVILLPGILGALFGWVHMLLPLLVFYYLVRYGAEKGKKYILFGCILACLAGLIFQIIEQLLFSLMLLPIGFALADSVKREDTPHMACMKATLALVGTWAISTSILSFGMEHHPYSILIEMLNRAMDDAQIIYQERLELPSESLFLLQQTFAQMKIWLPKVLPGILGCIALTITWITMVSGNLLLYKKTGVRPWVEYRYWVLPEKLVWLLIVSAILVVLPAEAGKVLGINLLLLICLIYCFQGMAILVFYMSKWNVPIFLRTIIYLILLFQSMGAILLGILGVVDVWTDMRNLNSGECTPDK